MEEVVQYPHSHLILNPLTENVLADDADGPCKMQGRNAVWVICLPGIDKPKPRPNVNCLRNKAGKGLNCSTISASRPEIQPMTPNSCTTHLLLNSKVRHSAQDCIHVLKIDQWRDAKTLAHCRNHVP